MTAEAINPDIQANLLEPFISAVGVTLRDLAATEAVPRGVRSGGAAVTHGDVSAVLVLTSDALRVLMMSFPQATAEALARRMLAEATSDVDDGLIRDCVGEMVNILAGQTKALFHGTPYHMTFTTPIILLGPNQEMPGGPTGEGFLIEFDSDVGSFGVLIG